MNTTPGGSVTCGGMVKLSDTATLSGGATRPARSPSTCSPRGSPPTATTATTSTATRSRSTATAPTPPAWAPTPAATRRRRPGPTSGWRSTAATRSNNATSDSFGSEPETVGRPARSGRASTRPAGSGRTRTARRSSAASTTVPPTRSSATGWRATSRTCSAARIRISAATLSTVPRSSLAGLTNAQIATLCTKLWNPTARPRTPTRRRSPRPGHLRRYQPVRREHDSPGVRLQGHLGGRLGGDVQRREQRLGVRRVQQHQPIGVLDPPEPQQQLQSLERQLLRRQPEARRAPPATS